MIDPERPIDLETLSTLLTPVALRLTGRRLFWKRMMRKAMLALGVVVGLAALWNSSAVTGTVNVARITGWIEMLRAHPLAPLLIVLGYVVGGLLLVPISVTVVATCIVFEPLTAFFYALGGALASATCLLYTSPSPRD